MPFTLTFFRNVKINSILMRIRLNKYCMKLYPSSNSINRSFKTNMRSNNLLKFKKQYSAYKDQKLDILSMSINMIEILHMFILLIQNSPLLIQKYLLGIGTIKNLQIKCWPYYLLRNP